MIQATKASVVTEFHLSSLEARSMELDYFLMVFDKLSSTASLLAGFASSALMVGIHSPEGAAMRRGRRGLVLAVQVCRLT